MFVTPLGLARVPSPMDLAIILGSIAGVACVLLVSSAFWAKMNPVSRLLQLYFIYQYPEAKTLALPGTDFGPLSDHEEAHSCLDLSL